MELRQIGNLDNDRRNFSNPPNGRVYDINGLSPTLTTCGGGNTEVKILESKTSAEITTTGAEIQTSVRVRKLTPRESWRLMGFSDEDFERAEEINSNSQLYKQAGNSIVKTVLMAIFSQMDIEGIKQWNGETNTEKYIQIGARKTEVADEEADEDTAATNEHGKPKEVL